MGDLRINARPARSGPNVKTSLRGLHVSAGSMFTFEPGAAARLPQARTRADAAKRFRGNVRRNCVRSLQRVGWPRLTRRRGPKQDRIRAGQSLREDLTQTSIDLRKRRLRERPLAPLPAGPDAVMSVAARRPRQRYQPAAWAFPVVIGSLWSDLAGRGQPLAFVPMSVRLCARLWGG